MTRLFLEIKNITLRAEPSFFILLYFLCKNLLFCVLNTITLCLLVFEVDRRLAGLGWFATWLGHVGVGENVFARLFCVRGRLDLPVRLLAEDAYEVALQVVQGDTAVQRGDQHIDWVVLWAEVYWVDHVVVGLDGADQFGFEYRRDWKIVSNSDTYRTFAEMCNCFFFKFNYQIHYRIFLFYPITLPIKSIG